jgi:hypothetical protein
MEEEKEQEQVKRTKTKRVGSDEYKVIDTPFTDFNKPKSMLHYIKFIEDNEEYYIYGTPTPIGYNPKRPSDARIVVFDDNGDMKETQEIWYITEYGYKYQVDKNGDVTEEQIKEYNKGGRWSFILKNETKRPHFQSHHVLLWSYYPKKNWSHFCINKKNGTATVDHILQKHSKCHFRFLEFVTKSENSSRNNIYLTETDNNNNKGRKGTPFHIIVNGKTSDVIESSQKGVVYLKKEYSISISGSTIQRHLKNGKECNQGDYTLSFICTDDYIEDNDDFQWIICVDEFDEKSELYKYCNGKMPYSLSHKGFVKDNYGRISRGTQVKCQETNNLQPNSMYGCKKFHKLIYLAFYRSFNKEPLTKEKPMILHDNQYETNLIENGKCIRYSNHIDSLRAGTQSENEQDKSNDVIIEKRVNPDNKIIVTDFAGDPVLTDVYSPNECKKKLDAMDKYKNENIKFDTCLIKRCLDPKNYRATHQCLIFKYVKIDKEIYNKNKKYPKLFVVKNNNEIEVGHYYRIVDCINALNKIYRKEKIKFNRTSIGNCLKRPSTYKTHQKHTFEYV